MARAGLVNRAQYAFGTNAIKAIKPLSDEKRNKLVRALELYTAAQGAYNVGRQLYGAWDLRRQHTVTVRSDDPIYPAVQEWLLEQVPISKQKAVVAQTMYGNRVADDDDVWDLMNGHANNEPNLAHQINDTTMRVIMIRGHKIRVYLNKADEEDDFGKTPTIMKPDTLHFIALSVEGQRAVLEELKTLVSKTLTQKRMPRLYVMSSHGHFSHRQDLPPRTIESVVLKKGQLDRITSDLDRFLESEREYVRRGIPWHRGYLLEGPPGTGKTSIARALAGHFGLDLYYAPLGDVTSDTKLMDLIGNVQKRSVLLLEDVDVFNAATSRESEKGEVSLSGFLNTLDGIATPHGLIVILTSNQKDALDPALVRAGRIDLVEHIGLPDTDQTTRLFEYFYGRKPADGPISPLPGMSPADIIEVFKQHLYEPQEAEDEFRLYLRNQKERI